MILILFETMEREGGVIHGCLALWRIFASSLMMGARLRFHLVEIKILGVVVRVGWLEARLG